MVKVTMKSLFLMLAILSCSTMVHSLFAQELDRYVLDEPLFIFRDGIYPNIELVKSNSPIPSTWVETSKEVSDRDFYKHITRAEEIIFFDDNGVRTVLETKRIWGYCQNGDLYVNVGGMFHKFVFIGRFSHFIASRTTYDPFFYTEEFRPGTYYIAPPILTYKNREYLVDILKNKAWEFDSDGLERVLKNDSLLLEEFTALKKRDKEYLKYIYLNRYNSKYPLQIPAFMKR